MTKTQNKYIYPVKLEDIIRISGTESPVHKVEFMNGIFRYAIDFFVPKGTLVLAAADGRVTEIKDDSEIGGNDLKYWDEGNLINIEHEFGEFSTYEHLKFRGVLVRPGERVRKGQQIGLNGYTGYTAGLEPHLHFMVFRYVTKDKFESLEIEWEDSFLADKR